LIGPSRTQGASIRSQRSHTLGPVVADLEQLTGVETRRIHVDKGYRGHNHPHKFRLHHGGFCHGGRLDLLVAHGRHRRDGNHTRRSGSRLLG